MEDTRPRTRPLSRKERWGGPNSVSAGIRAWAGAWLLWLFKPWLATWGELWNKRSYNIRSGAFMISGLALAYCLGAIAQGGPEVTFYKYMAGGALLMNWAIAFGANWLQAQFGGHSIGLGHGPKEPTSPDDQDEYRQRPQSGRRGRRPNRNPRDYGDEYDGDPRI